MDPSGPSPGEEVDLYQPESGALRREFIEIESVDQAGASEEFYHPSMPHEVTIRKTAVMVVHSCRAGEHEYGAGDGQPRGVKVLLRDSAVADGIY